MRLRCHLREFRGDRTLRDIAALTGGEVSAGLLSEIERGRRLVPDEHVTALERAYGHELHDWYEPRTLLVLETDGDDDG